MRSQLLQCMTGLNIACKLKKIWYSKLTLHSPSFIVIDPIHLTCRYRHHAHGYTDRACMQKLEMHFEYGFQKKKKLVLQIHFSCSWIFPSGIEILMHIGIQILFTYKNS